MTNIGIVLPEAGYHEAVRKLCTRHDVLLIIDETKTISAGPGGCTRAWGLRPDIVTIGKRLGAGIPCVAYGMSADVARRVYDRTDWHNADVGGVGGTLAGNALSLAAMRATLDLIRTDDAFARMIELGALRAGRTRCDRDAGPSLARRAPRLPRRAPVPSGRGAHRRRGRRRPGRAGGRRHPPVPAQPRHPDDAVPQHGTHVARDDRHTEVYDAMAAELIA